MNEVGDSFLEWTLAFEPDEDGEEELADEEEPIDKALITDNTIRSAASSPLYGPLNVEKSKSHLAKQSQQHCSPSTSFSTPSSHELKKRTSSSLSTKQQLPFSSLKASMTPRAKKQFDISSTKSSVLATLPRESTRRPGASARPNKRRNLRCGSGVQGTIRSGRLGH
jgi:hypothetical protein